MKILLLLLSPSFQVVEGQLHDAISGQVVYSEKRLETYCHSRKVFEFKFSSYQD